MDTEIDEPTEARPLFFYLHPFLFFFSSNGVKGRVPTFPRAIDRYLRNRGAHLPHTKVQDRRTYAHLVVFLKRAIKTELFAINKVPLSASNHQFPTVQNRASRNFLVQVHLY